MITRRSIWVLLLAITACASAGVSTLAEPTEKRDGLDLSSIIERASATQRALTELSAVFKVRVEIKTPAKPDEQRSTFLEALLEHGPVNGKLNWYRSGDRERVDLTFDVPQALAQAEFLDSIRIFHPEESVEWVILPTTKQVAICKCDHLGGRQPKDWLFPLRARAMDELAGKSNVELKLLDGSKRGARLEVAFTDSNPVRRCTLETSRDFSDAVTKVEWPGVLRSEIEFDRVEGTVVPLSAKLTFMLEPDVPYSVWTLERESVELQPPAAEVFEILPAGAGVADNRDGKVYLVAPNGRDLLPVRNVLNETEQSVSAPRIGAAVGVLAVAMMIAGFRVYSVNRRAD